MGLNFRRNGRKFESTRSWKTKQAAEKVRKDQPLSNSFKVVKSRKDGRYRIRTD